MAEHPSEVLILGNFNQEYT